MRYSEWNLQCDVVKLLRDAGWVVFHIPNERNSGIADSIRMKAGGVVKGAPDLLCLRHYNQCIFLELKTKTGKRSIEQVAVAAVLEDMGFEYRLVRSIEDIEDLT